MNGGFVTLPKAEVHVHLEGCFEVFEQEGPKSYRLRMRMESRRVVFGIVS